MSSMEKNGGRRARRVFSEEFRAGAVRLVLDESTKSSTFWKVPPSKFSVLDHDGLNWTSTVRASAPWAIGPWFGMDGRFVNRNLKRFHFRFWRRAPHARLFGFTRRLRSDIWMIIGLLTLRYGID